MDHARANRFATYAYRCCAIVVSVLNRALLGWRQRQGQACRACCGGHCAAAARGRKLGFADFFRARGVLHDNRRQLFERLAISVLMISTMIVRMMGVGSGGVGYSTIVTMGFSFLAARR